jgi:alpha-ketoglutarate-dependent taurine dioxygenase
MSLATDAGGLEMASLEGSALPLLARPRAPGMRLDQALPGLAGLVDRQLPQVGAILFRGFAVPGLEAFRAFASGFGHPLLGYELGSTPRSQLAEGVYTSTEYPAHQAIPLHNEQSYTRQWPLRIWFWCEVAALEGGETPIADSREIYRQMPASIRTSFVERSLMYVRNFGRGLDLPWQRVFGTGDRRTVERICRERGIACEWSEGGALRTRERCQAVARHPHTGDVVWFNQAHLFHVSALAPEMREALAEVLDERDLPRNVYYGDGTPIEDAVLDEVRGVLERNRVAFPWQAGDVLMLDNMLTAHARAPFKGPRRVVVAMAQGHEA